MNYDNTINLKFIDIEYSLSPSYDEISFNITRQDPIVRKFLINNRKTFYYVSVGSLGARTINIRSVYRQSFAAFPASIYLKGVDVETPSNATHVKLREPYSASFVIETITQALRYMEKMIISKYKLNEVKNES
jgi:hypothetical protein